MVPLISSSAPKSLPKASTSRTCVPLELFRQMRDYRFRTLCQRNERSSSCRRLSAASGAAVIPPTSSCKAINQTPPQSRSVSNKTTQPSTISRSPTESGDIFHHSPTCSSSHVYTKPKLRQSVNLEHLPPAFARSSPASLSLAPLQHFMNVNTTPTAGKLSFGRVAVHSYSASQLLRPRPTGTSTLTPHHYCKMADTLI